jgi:hypothetical protein
MFTWDKSKASFTLLPVIGYHYEKADDIYATEHDHTIIVHWLFFGFSLHKTVKHLKA